MLFDCALDVLTGGAHHLILKKYSVFLFFWGFSREKEKNLGYWLLAIGYMGQAAAGASLLRRVFRSLIPFIMAK